MLDQRGPDGTPGAGRDLQPVADPRRRSDRSGRPCRARDVLVFGHGRRGGADRRSVLSPRDRSHLAERRRTEALHHRRHRRARRGEAFGDDYELPNATAYNETCAAVGNDFWNHRLFLLHGEARYIDVLERTLYNGLLSGVSLDGKSFFYPNPLESAGQYKRSPWFGVACCPGNITRFLASLAGYVYAQRADSILRQPVHRRVRGHRDGEREQGAARAGHPLSVGWRRADHRQAADAGTVHAADPRARAGPATTPCRAISTTS